MRLNMLGCGDAYDSDHTNASLLVSEGDFTLLIDCGPTVPRAIFSMAGKYSTTDENHSNADNSHRMDEHRIDAIYLTHAHPDHCLGLTTLVNWMNAKGRNTPLTIIGQQSQWEIFSQLIHFAHWPEERLSFDIHFIDVLEITHIGPWSVKTAPTFHAVSNRSLYIENSHCALFYSGDGKLGDEGEKLAIAADVAFIECESVFSHESHGSWEDVRHLPFTTRNHCFLYHVDPNCRAELNTLCQQHPQIALAQDGLTLSLNALKVNVDVA